MIILDSQEQKEILLAALHHEGLLIPATLARAFANVQDAIKAAEIVTELKEF